MAIYVKDTAAASRGEDSKDREREYIFMSIDRSEYANLNDYLNSKEIKVKNPVVVRKLLIVTTRRIRCVKI